MLPDEDFELFFFHGLPFAAEVLDDAFFNVDLQRVQVLHHIVVFNIQSLKRFGIGFEFSRLHLATELTDLLGAETGKVLANGCFLLRLDLL